VTTIALTLGGFRPGLPYWGIPHLKQSWWKPCLTRGEGGDTHCWYLSPCSDGSLYCHACRVGRPRVYVGPRERVAEIKAALEAGDLARAQSLAWGNAPITPAVPTTAKPRWRDRADWQEWWTERAAIFEFLGGMSRAEAERAATELVGPYTGE
jgi:hypothetical protein